jgi:hypothetical protein
MVFGGPVRIILLTTIAAIAAIPSLAGQQAPDLTGTWVMDVTRSASPTAGGHQPAEAQALPLETLVIQHTPDELIVERRSSNTSAVVRYLFNTNKSLATLPAGKPERTAQPVGTSGSGDGTLNAARTTGVRDASPLAPRRASDTEPAGELHSEVQDARAEVKNGRIVTKMVMNINGKTVTIDETLYLAEDGRDLIVERLLTVHHGYEGAAKPYAEGKDVFIRR